MESIGFLFNVGGWTMYAIVVCSILALAIFLERLWALRASQVTPRDLWIDVEEHMKHGKVNESMTLCRKSPSSLSRLLLVGLQNHGKDRAEVKEHLNEAI